MGTFQSGRKAKAWAFLIREHRKLRKLNLDEKEITFLLDSIDLIRATVPRQWRAAKVQDLVREYIEQLDTLERTGLRDRAAGLRKNPD